MENIKNAMTPKWLRKIPPPKRSDFITLPELTKSAPRQSGRNAWPTPDGLRRAHFKHRSPPPAILWCPSPGFMAILKPYLLESLNGNKKTRDFLKNRIWSKGFVSPHVLFQPVASQQSARKWPPLRWADGTSVKLEVCSSPNIKPVWVKHVYIYI